MPQRQHVEDLRAIVELRANGAAIDTIEDARRALRERSDGTPLERVRRRLGLDACAMETLVAIAYPPSSTTAPVVVDSLVDRLAMSASDDALMRRSLDHDAPLVAAGLVDITRGILTVDERVHGWLGGDVALDRRVRTLVSRVEAIAAPLDPTIRVALERALATPGPLLVEGAALIGKLTAVSTIACERNETVLVVERSHIASAHDPLDVLRLVQREALLCDARLVIRVDGWADRSSPLDREILGAVQSGDAIAIAVDADAIARQLVGVRRIEIGMPSLDHQRVLWARELRAAIDVDRVLASYPLPPGEIVRAAAAVRAAVELEQRHVRVEDVVDAARARIAHRLGDVADLVVATTAWEDVILADEAMSSVREIVDAVLHRDHVMNTWGFAEKLPYGRAITALLSGPPGTGKTMIATLIGTQLGLEVFRVDLSKVVSKYIGETEKALARVFDEASRCRAILLFDEADSLFSKRTEVRSSNDRFANLEVNFLLQRLEAHDGVVLLTTNSRSSIDRAFMRRIRYRIELDEPDTDERARLWRSMVPPAAPIGDDVDFCDLARRFQLTGGHIKNALVRAAFRAIREGSAITHAILVDAAAQEWTELGNLLPHAGRTPPRGPWIAPPAIVALPSERPIERRPERQPDPQIEALIRATLRSDPRFGETIDGAFRRKEHELAVAFDTLSPTQAQLLHDRLSAVEPDDDLAALFARLTGQRRQRLLGHLLEIVRRPQCLIYDRRRAADGTARR